MIFIDLTKAFDSVHQEGLWKILMKFTNIIRSFHDEMHGCVLDNGATSAPFIITNGRLLNKDAYLPRCYSVSSSQ